MTWRKSTVSVAAWAFGVSVTVLLIALWGRAVVVDTETLGASLAPLSESTTVVDAFTDWAGDEMVDSGVDPQLVKPTIEYILESTSVGASLEGVIVDVVDAAASTDPDGSSVDMRGHLEPAIPEVTAGLVALGAEVSESQVAEIVHGLRPFIVRKPGESALVGHGSPAAARLSTAALLGVLGIVVFGAAVLSIASERIAAVRDLLTRVALGGMSFAILLRLGSWILDPAGGRAPVAETAAALARSKWMVPFQIGLVAGALATGMYLVRRWLRPVGATPSAPEPPTPRSEQELSLSMPDSGHRS